MSLRSDCKGTLLEDYVEASLEPLGKDKGHLQEDVQDQVLESVNFERYVKAEVDENVPVWDYLINVGASLRNSSTHALEVHPCDPAEAEKILRKKSWSEEHLALEAPKVGVERWIWVASAAMNIVPGLSPEFFKLQQSGIEVCSRKGYKP